MKSVQFVIVLAATTVLVIFSAQSQTTSGLVRACQGANCQTFGPGLPDLVAAVTEACLFAGPGDATGEFEERPAMGTMWACQCKSNPGDDCYDVWQVCPLMTTGYPLEGIENATLCFTTAGPPPWYCRSRDETAACYAPGLHNLSIDLVILINGQPAVEPPGPVFLVGDQIEIEYLMINNGLLPIDSVGLTPGLVNGCGGFSDVASGSQVSCSAEIMVQPGSFEITQRAIATNTVLNTFTVSDTETAYYFGGKTDADGDSIFDSFDNCIFEANSDQRDTNSDGFGNICDADLNNDCIVNLEDLGLFRSVFLSQDDDADFNGDGAVNFVDLNIFRTLFFAPPGPSGLTVNCN